MEKMDNIEKAKWEQEGKEISQKIRAAKEKLIESLPPEQKEFVQYCRCGKPKDGCVLSKKLRKGLRDGTYKKPSEFFASECGWLFGGVIYERFKASFMYEVDNLIKYQYQRGWSRRSFRTSDYSVIFPIITNVVEEYVNIPIDRKLSDILDGNLTDDEKLYCRHYYAFPRRHLSYLLDTGDERAVGWVRSKLSVGDEQSFSRLFIDAVMYSENTELIDLVGKMLVAARLQEGLRQAICERCDGGTMTAFRSILGVIKDNDLIRFSSVKRAVGTWCGLIAHKSDNLERVSGKTVELICRLLDDTALREECLSSEDTMKIWLALWAYGCEDAAVCMKKLEAVNAGGTIHQLHTAALFSTTLFSAYLKVSPAKQYIFDHPTELGIVALCLPMVLDGYLQYLGEGEISSVLNGEDNAFKAERIFDESYSSPEEAAQMYRALMQTYKAMPKKEVSFPHFVFPRLTVSLDKAVLVKNLALIAAAVGDKDMINAVMPLLSDIPTSTYYSKRTFYAVLLINKLPGGEQRDAYIAMLYDKSNSARNYAFSKLRGMELLPEHYTLIEDMLRYKAEDTRRNALDFLMQLTGDKLYACAERLLSDKKEEKRTAGLDILLQLSENEDRKEEYAKLCPLAALVTEPSVKEQILLDRLSPGTDSAPAYGYGLYRETDSYTPAKDEEYYAECKKTFLRFFPASEAFGGTGSLPDFKPILEKLDRLIEDNKNLEFVNDDGEEVLLGNTRWLYTNKHDENGHRMIAFPELWDKFYDEEIHDPYLLLPLRMSLSGCTGFEKIKRQLFGFMPFERSQLVRTELTLAHERLIDGVIAYLERKFSPIDEYAKLAFAVDHFIADYPARDDLFEKTERSRHDDGTSYYFDGEKIVCDKENRVRYIYDDRMVSDITANSEKYDIPDSFKRDFDLSRRLAEKFGTAEFSKEKIRRRNFGDNMCCLGYAAISIYVRAAFLGIISEGFLYRHIIEETDGHTGVFKFLCGIVRALRERERKLMQRRSSWHYDYDTRTALEDLLRMRNPELNEETLPCVEFAASVYEKLITVVLDTELKRGDSQSDFSDFISGISLVYGIDRFVQILCALGKDTLERMTYGCGENPSKRESLSHLLGVCVPAPDDTAEKLRAAIKGKGISEKRLVEAALYSPEWIDIIGELLDWKGFRSACFWFIAHTRSDLDEARMAKISRYTPLGAYALMRGVFAVDWFREAYAEIGEERFNIIYDAAKYISEGANHTRARKYADAVLGRLDEAKALEAIHKKRSKDMLSAYMLMPVNSDSDLTERYLHIQQFRKESANYGKQRRESESDAADIAMENLAVAAGFDDVTRLTLRMENAVFDSIKELTEPKQIGEVTLRLSVDELGKASVEVMKNGKPQKSIPAKLGKDEYVIRLKETRRRLDEQYRRTKAMFARSLEDRTEYKAGELVMLLGNPVTKPIIGNLVFMNGSSSGFLTEDGLVSADGTVTALPPETPLIVAHPFDLYTEGTWREYQQLVYDRGMVQPFKQIFRELYLKTDEEREKYNTLRYSGNQIQPKQAIACLRSRRWSIDEEDGLRRVFYKENIAARIYALADWFTPADIESPTLEWVEFSDRITGTPVKIGDIPDVIFSEVMRDVDLVVSVAHAGQVDPEASHSTIEMRRAICEFTAKLFKLENVRFEKSHAFITGKRADYAIHLGSGVIHIQGGAMINVLPVHSQHRGKLFLPFVDDDPKTAQIVTEILFFAEDKKIKDPYIIEQINR